MKSRNTAGTTWLVAVSALLVTLAIPAREAAAINKNETKCYGALTKAVSKHLNAVTAAMAECRNAVLAAGSGTCPDATATAAITKSKDKVSKTALKKCQSDCSLSELPCIDSAFCPPNGLVTEECNDGFQSTDMGFPGPYCNTVLGHSMADPQDFPDCATGLASVISAQILSNLYGDIAGAPSADAAKCLAALVKAAPKGGSKAANSVAKCRNTQLTAEAPTVDPDNCATGDEKTAKSVNKAHDKFVATVEKSCPASVLATLDFCGAGVGATTTVAAAQACLGDLFDQISFSTANPASRAYAPISIINAVYPDSAAAVCGDNLINQLPNQFLLTGEECDGTANPCTGNAECLPPGDTFECTCANIARGRVFADGFAADLDNGWSGSSHNAKVPDQAGFVSEVSNCDCTAFTGATCTGSTGDPECNISADVSPRCSNRASGNTDTCDEAGNGNGAHTDTDCRACDEFSANSGLYCTNTARYCLSGGNNGDACNNDGDCPGMIPAQGCVGTGACSDGPFLDQGCSASIGCGVCSNNPTAKCLINSNCPGGTCVGHTCSAKTCVNGTSEGAHCDDDADCSGGRCAEHTDCTAQCYPEAGGAPTGICASQTDCADGERCRGICDDSAYCLKIRNGAPLPLSAEGVSVCVDSQFFSNVSGTKDIVTGGHAIFYELRSVVILANDLNSVPCPVCGGWCAENSPHQSHDRLRCNGNCSGGANTQACRFGPNIGELCANNTECGGFLCDDVACRFDEDCSVCTLDPTISCADNADCTGNGTCDSGRTCDGSASPDCLGKACNLGLTCNSGPNQFDTCRIEAYTAFGTTSADCPPDPATNLTGAGLEIHWEPLTSGNTDFSSLPNNQACDQVGFENYDCNCVFPPVNGVKSQKNQPNRCAAACNSTASICSTGNNDGAVCTDNVDCTGGGTCTGTNFGEACGDANNFTTCVGGDEDGEHCDENADCASGGGTCTGNPRNCSTGGTGTCSVSHCSGGGFDGNICGTIAQCGGFPCIADACVVGGSCTVGTCLGNTCTANGDCGAGTCDDRCPGGFCTPLCVTRGKCYGGVRDGLLCAVDTDCSGGSCGDDPSTYEEEGACAQGHFNHCDGPGWEFVGCTPLNVGTKIGCETGPDAVLGNSDDQVGAGFCRADVTNCYTDNGHAEGGTTINGRGDPTNTYSVTPYCIPATSNSSVNGTSGLPGPGRIRQPALNVTNYDHLPLP